MTDAVVVDTSRLRGGRGVKARPKGRHVDAEALADVRRILGDAPRERSLLIEHLHRVQDAKGYLPASYLVALAQEMKLAMTEVYEVATFYHHFDVVDADDTPPPPITVRVCETLSCKMAGGDALREALAGLGDARVRVIGAPCIGRCEQAPAAVVGRNAIGNATVADVVEAIRTGRVEAALPTAIDYAAYRRDGGYRTLVDCVTGKRTADAVIAELESSSLRGLGGAGFPAGRKWRIVRAHNRWQAPQETTNHPFPGTYPVVVTGEADWGGWRVPGSEYALSPMRMEQQARMIASTPQMIALLKELVETAKKSPETPMAMREQLKKAAGVIAYAEGGDN